MKRIFKYELDITDRQNLDLPYGAEILSIQDQQGRLCLWALIDDSQETKGRIIRIFGTGNPLPDDIDIMEYITTVQLRDGALVWHFFEE